MLKLAASPGVTWVTSHMCSFGLKDPVSHLPMKKAMSFFHNFPVGIWDLLGRHYSGNHQHQQVEGSVKGHGSRGILSQFLPRRFCSLPASLIGHCLNGNSSRPHRNFMTDILSLIRIGDAKNMEPVAKFRVCVDHAQDSIAIQPHSRNSAMRLLSWHSEQKCLLIF